MRTRARRVLVPVLAVAAVLVLVAAGYGFGVWRGWWVSPSVSDPPQATPAAVAPLATGLRAPWDVAFLPDGTALVTERDTTRLLSVAADGTVAEVQRIEQAHTGGEGGLLGVAVSPEYDQDGWVYVYYTTADDNRVARLQPGEQPEPVFTGIPAARIHNGGRIAFGPDGMLYVTTGDADDPDRAQDRTDLAGTILRITPDGDPAPGNPFGDDSPVYSVGHRNVQGLAFDGDGNLYASEFGPHDYDELNRIEPGGNYGWPEVSGPGGAPEFTDPVATWHPSEASCSGVAYLDGWLWKACLRGQRLYRIGPDGSSPTQLLAGEYGRLRHVAVAPDGTLWVLTNNHDGRGAPGPDDDQILRVTP